MARKNVILTTLFVLAVAIVLFYEYRDAFTRRPIQISHTFRMRMIMARRMPANSSATVPLVPTFVLGSECRLTSVKVIRIDELKKKGFAHPLWELVTDTKSYPVKTFLYGRKIPGMRPKVEDVPPDPLETNVAYRIMIEAGRSKGQEDFTISSQDAALPGAQ